MKLTACMRLHLALTAGLVLCALATPLLAQEKASRIVALGGSVTEIAVALGAQDRLIARDTTSTFPEGILALPDVGYIRALSPEGVLSVGPDLILSEAGAGPAEAVAVLKAAGVPFVQVSGDPTPQGIVAKITDVAAALDLPAEGAALAAQVDTGLKAAEARAAAVTGRKRVLFILSLQGGRVMAGGEGTEAAGIIALAGGENAATGFHGYKPMTDEAVLAAAPDVILMMDREGDLAMSNEDVMAQPALAQTPAAQAGRVVRMDGLLLLGFGPRTPEAAAKLYDALYGAGG
jgi:iron complex transport system substrate-binding protein